MICFALVLTGIDLADLAGLLMQEGELGRKGLSIRAGVKQLQQSFNAIEEVRVIKNQNIVCMVAAKNAQDE